MKIITWNCNMAFRKKAEYIMAYKPDILVIPECEHPSKLKFPNNVQLPSNIIWYGENTNKGLGVFSFGNYNIQLLDWHNTEIKTILPIEVTKGDLTFSLLAIWANNTGDESYQYIGQVWKALNCYRDFIRNDKVIIIGDFNSNAIWDKPKREWNHSNVVRDLESIQIYSTYHMFFKQEQGKEVHPTLYLYRHINKPYHIDYCFVSKYFLDNLKQVEVGKYESWNHLSDHKPLIVKFEI